MSATLTTALEQLDKAIVAVDQALASRLKTLEQRNTELTQQLETERRKNATATQELNATIGQLETYLGRTNLQRTGS